MKRIKQFERTDRDITNALLLLLEKNRFEKITMAQIFVKIFYRTILLVTFLYLTNLSNPVFCIFQKKLWYRAELHDFPRYRARLSQKHENSPASQ